MGLVVQLGQPGWIRSVLHVHSGNALDTEPGIRLEVVSFNRQIAPRNSRGAIYIYMLHDNKDRQCIWHLHEHSINPFKPITPQTAMNPKRGGRISQMRLPYAVWCSAVWSTIPVTDSTILRHNFILSFVYTVAVHARFNHNSKRPSRPSSPK